MELLIWVVPVAGIAAVLFALYLARDVMSRDTGTPEMVAVGDMIREGADAFVRRQYTTIGILALVGVGRHRPRHRHRRDRGRRRRPVARRRRRSGS